jgi:translation initiation factor 6 (eIF-6)
MYSENGRKVDEMQKIVMLLKDGGRLLLPQAEDEELDEILSYVKARIEIGTESSTWG